MKVAIITDQHFGARNDSIQFLDYYEKFYNETFFPKLLEENIRTVLILGDTFDRRKYINFYTLKKAKEMFFNRLFVAGIQVYMLAGNHDTYFKNTNEVNSIDLLLQEYTNIEVIDTPQIIHLEYSKESHDVCMIPWICPENYNQCIDLLENPIPRASICCGHFEISGFAMYRGMPSGEGLSRELFRKFDYTFTGHYHHKSDANGIYYLGNPYELTWQDYNDPRGFHLFDLDSRELEFVRNPNRMFYKISYDDKSESVTDISSKDFSEYANKYVRVVVVNKTNPYLFDRFIENLYQVNPIDVSIAEDLTDLTEGVDDEILNEAEDTLTIINKYIDNVTEEHIDNKKLKNILKELYIEALNTEKT